MFSPYMSLPDTWAPGSQHTRRKVELPVRLMFLCLALMEAALSTAILFAGLYMWVKYHRTGLLPPEEPHKRSQFDLFDSWFISSSTIVGFIGLVAAVAGISGTRLEKRQRLLFFSYVIGLFFLCESISLLLLFSNLDWKEKLPDDPSGFFDLFCSWVAENRRLAKVSGLASSGVHLVSIGLAVALHAIYSAEYHDWLDSIELHQERYRRHLDATIRKEAFGSQSSSHGKVIRSKYGFDSKDMEALEARERQSLVYVLDSG